MNISTRFNKYPIFTLCALLFLSLVSHAMENKEEKNSIKKFIDTNGFTTLRNAIEQGNIDYLKYVVRFGTDINMMMDPITHDSLLHIAVNANQYSIVWYLLEHGANPLARNKKNIDPFSKSNDIKLVKIFTKKFAQLANIPIENGKTLWMLATEKGDLTAIKEWFVLYDPNPWIVDDNDNTALTYAIYRFLHVNSDNSLEILKILSAYSFKNSYRLTIDEIDRYDYKTLESEAAVKGRIVALVINDESLSAYKKSILKDFDINSKDGTGNTIFTHNYYNKEKRRGFIGDQLIHYANINNRDNEGNTPLHGTMKSSQLPGLLIMAGADISVKNNDGELAIDSLNDTREFGWCKKFLTLTQKELKEYDYILFFQDSFMVDYFISKSLYEKKFDNIKILLSILKKMYTVVKNMDQPTQNKLNTINNNYTNNNLLLKSYYFRDINSDFLPYLIDNADQKEISKEQKEIVDANLSTILFYELLTSDYEKDLFADTKENSLIRTAHDGIKKGRSSWSWDNLLRESIEQERVLIKNILIILSQAALSKKSFRIACTLEALDGDTYEDVSEAIALRDLMIYLKKSHTSRKNLSNSYHHSKNTLNKIYHLILEYLTGMRLLTEPMDQTKMIDLKTNKPIETESKSALRLSPEIVNNILGYLPYQKDEN